MYDITAVSLILQ